MTTSTAVLRRAALATLMPGFAGDRAPDWLLHRLDEGLGAVCLFAGNITSPSGVRSLTDRLRAAHPDVVVAVDEEGGDVTRLWHHAGGSWQPGNAVLGRLDDEAVTARAAGALAGELHAAGVTLTLGPVVDVNSNPDNPVIGTRSFGDRTDVVARHGAAWVRAMQAGGVAACAKHFPGHGDTATDSHLATPVLDLPAAALADRELVPFAAAVGAGVEAVMTSHVLLPRLDPAAPATMSGPVLHLLQDGLGFPGVVVTDALDMAGARHPGGMAGGAVAALAAGADLLCLGSGSTAALVDDVVAALVAAVRDGRLPESRLAAAGDRTRRLARRHPAPASDLPPAQSSRPVLAPDRVAGTFHVSPHARDLLSRPRPVVLVRLETEPNIAVGPGAWGPFGLPGTGGAPVLTAAEALAAPERAPLSDEDLLVVVGRDNHLHESSREAVRALRARHPATLAVDMGWARPDAGYADLATYGASPAVGQALLHRLHLGVAA